MSYFRPYKYVKDESKDPLYKPISARFALRTAGYPVVFLSLGIFFVITQIFLPLFAFTATDKVIKPAESTVLGVASGFRSFEFSELNSMMGTTTDLNVPSYYYLTVPKLGIDNALVDTSPKDLNPDDALGHYVGSVLPGEIGNTFIYGHSVLPAFYNPVNYKTIFSTLYQLKIGDEFTIRYNNKDLTYKVEGKEELKPEEVDPLKGYKPKYLNESTVTLMTCFPSGTKIRRLLINAVLIS